jgi:hypothetical protein
MSSDAKIKPSSLEEFIENLEFADLEQKLNERIERFIQKDQLRSSLSTKKIKV